MKSSMQKGFGRVASAMALAALALGWAANSAKGQFFTQGAAPPGLHTAGAYVFAGGSYFKPDYGVKNDPGFVFGAAWTRYLRLGGISLEPQFGWSSGDYITQKYFLLDLKLEHALGRHSQFHPFAEGGIGVGQMSIGHPNLLTETSKPIETFVAGLDYDLGEHFGVKGDWQYQFWDFGYTSNGLTPSATTIGLYYRITENPFHRRRR